MKQLRVSEDFILEAHKEACSTWKSKIENEFPSLFESKLEVGEWYKHKMAENSIVFKVNCIGYGFWNGIWNKKWPINDVNSWTLATEKEVETALIDEAKKRGFKEGVKFNRVNSVTGKCDDTVDIILKNIYWNGFGLITSYDYIFYNGVWAEIIEQKEMTIEQIENELGYKIKIEK